MKLGKILSKAFDTTFKHKYLWLLSFLAIIGGVASETQFNFNFQFPSELFSNTPPDTIQDIFDTIKNNIHSYIPIIIIVLLILLLISIALLIIGLIAKAGQIDSFLQIDQNKSSGFYPAMSSGKHYAWRIFLLRLIYGISCFVSILILIPLIIITFLFFFITIPLTIIYFGILSILLKNTEILIIKNNLGIIEAIKQSWHLTCQNWKDILFLWLVNFGIQIGISIVLFFFGIIVFIFSVFLAIISGVLVMSTELSFVIPILIFLAIFIILIAIAISLIMGSILHTFFTGYWTFGINSLLPKKSNK